MNYYRRFIPKYALVDKPLNLLISGDNTSKIKKAVPWSDDCQETFHKIKELCSSALILMYADLSQPFKIHTDVSNIGLRAVLYQNQNGGDRVITYASRLVSKSD